MSKKKDHISHEEIASELGVSLGRLYEWAHEDHEFTRELDWVGGGDITSVTRPQFELAVENAFPANVGGAEHPPRDMLSVEEAVRYSGFSRQVLTNAIGDKELEAFDVNPKGKNRRWRIAKQAVDAWLGNRRAASSSPGDDTLKEITQDIARTLEASARKVRRLSEAL